MYKRKNTTEIQTVIDLFCVAGNTEAFKDNFTTIGGIVDIDDGYWAMETFKRNYGNTKTIPRDPKDVKIEDAKQLFGAKTVDGIIASPPCWRNFNKEKIDQLKKNLETIIRFVNGFEAKFLFLEYTPDVWTKHPELLQLLKDNLPEYTITHRVQNAANFGVAQYRKRIFIVAIKGVKFEHPIGNIEPVVTVKEAIGHFPIPTQVENPDYPNHVCGRELSEANKQRLRLAQQGIPRSEWPSHLQLDCFKSGNGGHSDSYTALEPNKPSNCITTSSVSFTQGKFGHYEQLRNITPREAAALQSFPMTFVFEGGRDACFNQIANAIPVLAGKAYANSIKQTLDKCNKRTKV
jgi:DNA (cytosine-5)-methyltransferase 1